MRSVLTLPAGAKEWRSRDAALRLTRAMQDPQGRPRWVLEVKASKHKRGRNPSLIVKAMNGTEYKIKALRSEYIVAQYRKSYPDADVILLAIPEGEAFSRIRERVFDRLNTIRQKK